jgi:ribosomal protein L11 methyltransferase
MWLSVTLLADPDRAEALSDTLLAHGALSVAIDDADAGTEREQPRFGEPGAVVAPLWQSTRVSALFDAGADLPAALAGAAADAGLDGVPPYETGLVDDCNWVELTQSQFEPIRIDARLWIVPSWHVAPDPAAINIVLDPGMAFGTGSHPTTRLCLQWLCRNIAGGESVLDYGTGSGILAIAAAKLGARRILGVDIDEAALQAAGRNAARNGVAVELCHSRARLDGEFDRVVANILTNPLRVLAPLLAARLRRGGRIALSGVLDEQEADVIDAYAPFVGLAAGGRAEGWVLLEGRRP